MWGEGEASENEWAQDEVRMRRGRARNAPCGPGVKQRQAETQVDARRVKPVRRGKGRRMATGKTRMEGMSTCVSKHDTDTLSHAGDGYKGRMSGRQIS